MPLGIFSIDPQIGLIDVPIDSKVVIEFDQAIDPFTVETGVSLYVLSDGLWTGPELSILDSKYSDVLTVGNEYTFFAYKWELENNDTRLVITPNLGLLPNKKHFLQVLPGNDATRYLSLKTWAEPVYTRVGTSDGVVAIASSYIGKTHVNFTMDLSASASGAVDTIDVVKEGVYLGSYKTTGGIVNLKDITLEFTGTWDVGDSISIDCFPAEGVTDIYKTSFITNEYNTVSVKSFKLETIEQSLVDPLVLLDVFPKPNSINNQKMNPITLKFNKAIDPTQDLTDLIGLSKLDIETGEERVINFIPVVSGNIVKLYLNSVK